MYSFLKIGVGNDLEVTYGNEKFYVRVTNWKHYGLNKLFMRIVRFLFKFNMFKLAYYLMKYQKYLPVIKIRNKKYPGETYEFSIYKSDDLYAKLFELQNAGLRCRLDLIIPCIQEDILIEFFREKDID